MTIVICTDHLYNQLFSENVIVEEKKKEFKAIYRVMFGCLECILYILVRRTTWQKLKRF